MKHTSHSHPLAKVCTLVLLCAVLLSALCGGALAEDYSELFGEVKGTSYENAFLGYGCDLSGWHLSSDEEIAAIYQSSKEKLSEEIVNLVEASQNITVMGAEDLLGSNSLLVQLQYAKQYIPYYNILGMEAVIDAAMEQMISIYENAGIQMLSTEKNTVLMGEDEYIGLKLVYMMDTVTVYCQQTCFLRGDYVVYVTATSHGSDQTKESFSRFYSLSADSAVEEATAAQESIAAENVFIDEEVPLRFVIPEGWEQKALTQERQTVKAKLVNSSNSLGMILYSCMDAAAQYGTSEEAVALYRVLLDSEDLDVDTMATLFDMNPEELQQHQYGECTYFLLETDGLFGKVYTAILLKDGYLIMFEMQGVSVEQYTGDFATLLGSVTFE